MWRWQREGFDVTVLRTSWDWDLGPFQPVWNTIKANPAQMIPNWWEVALKLIEYCMISEQTKWFTAMLTEWWNTALSESDLCLKNLLNSVDFKVFSFCVSAILRKPAGLFHQFMPQLFVKFTFDIDYYFQPFLPLWNPQISVPECRTFSFNLVSFALVLLS